MATATATKVVEFVFEWEGRDRNGKQVRGETRAAGENQVNAALRRQGVSPTKVKKRRMRSGSAIKPKDIAIFTRQLATMMKAGVPLLQAFDIVAKGHAKIDRQPGALMPVAETIDRQVHADLADAPQRRKGQFIRTRHHAAPADAAEPK